VSEVGDQRKRLGLVISQYWFEEPLSGVIHISLGRDFGEPFSRTGSESSGDFLVRSVDKQSLVCHGFDKLSNALLDWIMNSFLRSLLELLERSLEGVLQEDFPDGLLSGFAFVLSSFSFFVE